MNNMTNRKKIDFFPKLFESSTSEMHAFFEGKIGASANTFVLHEGLVSEMDPLLAIPVEVKDSITTEFYEPAMTSILERYIRDKYLKKNNYLERLMTSLYRYAVRKRSHILAWNTIVVLSELPYMDLGAWADMLAVSATRSEYMDIVEMGVRCFENWENVEACEFLKGCHFEEKWLQEYANQVCEYVMKEGWSRNVLLTESYSWKMAERIGDSPEHGIDKYSSRYSSGRVQNG